MDTAADAAIKKYSSGRPLHREGFRWTDMKGGQYGQGEEEDCDYCV